MNPRRESARNRPSQNHFPKIIFTYMDGTYEQIVYNYLDPVLQRDRDGHWTAMVYDPLRHLTDTYDNLGRHTQFAWCNCGSLESITDPMGNVTQFIRDLQSRVQTKIYPDLTQINYAYETNSSRLLSVTDAKNQSTLYSYFVDNNLKQVTYSNAVVATPSVSFTYDTNYNRIVTMVDGTGTNYYNYYAVTNGQFGAGQLSSISNSFIGSSSLITYSYDALGRITNRAINGVSQQITFDTLNRVSVITNVLGNFTNVYLGATALLTTNFAPLGKKTIYSYLTITNDERLSEILNQKTNSTTLSKFDYAYDPVGNITNWTQQTDTTATNVQVMQYDPVNQLLADTVHSNTVAGIILKQFAYGYDLSGNRTAEQIGTGTNGPVAISQSSYNNDNQVTNRIGGSGAMLFAGSLSEQATVSVGGNAATVNHGTTNFVGYSSVISGTNVIPIIATDYSNNSKTNKYQIVATNNGVAETITYDLNGNETNVVTATSTNSYQWDAADRLVSATEPTNQSLFTYDGLGRMVQIIEKTNGVAYTTNKFVWDGQTIVEQRDLSGTNVTKRFFGEGEQISGTNYYFTRDHLGSIREMVNSVGVIQYRANYDPYPHPSLEPVLRDAFGLVVYEEHILQICEAFAGLPPGRADVLRRALNKQKRAVIEEIRQEFFASSIARGHGVEKIQEVWGLVTGFAGYAFCKAHSTAYGVEAYQAAWLKCNHPAEFMAAVLTNGKGFYDPLVYVLESYRLGLKFLPPSVNEPGVAFVVHRNGRGFSLRVLRAGSPRHLLK